MIGYIILTGLAAAAVIWVLNRIENKRKSRGKK